MAKVLVLYYSMYGHIETMATAAAEGVRSVEGADVTIKRVPDLVLEDVARKAGAKVDQVAPIATVDELPTYDAILFGTPTRFGNMCAQMKQYFDGAVELWGQGALEGKPAGVLVSTATTHGGQETTCFTMMAPLLHLGFIIVGVPYSTPGMLHTEGRGGTPYGATTVAGGKNDLEPAPEDLSIAKALGARVAQVAQKLRG